MNSIPTYTIRWDFIDSIEESVAEVWIFFVANELGAALNNVFQYKGKVLSSIYLVLRSTFRVLDFESISL